MGKTARARGIMPGHSSYKDINRWQQASLIDVATADKLRAELDSRPGFISLPFILTLVAAILVSAALIIFVAANWQDMPKLLRVGLVCLVVLGSYIYGGWKASHGAPSIADCFYLIGALAFGAAIALIGQIYHMSGDEYDAILLWYGMTLMASLLLRSKILASLIIILALWLYSIPLYDDRSILAYILPNLAYLVLGLLVCWWTKSRLARHCWIVLFFAFICYVLIYNDGALLLFDVMTVLFIAIFVVDWLFPDFVERCTRFSTALGNWMLFFALGFLLIRQLNVMNNMSIFRTHWLDNDFWPRLLFATIIIGIDIMALWSAGSRGKGTMTIALAFFVIEVYYLIWSTVDTLMMQSIFFLIAAIVCFVLARFAIRYRGRWL